MIFFFGKGKKKQDDDEEQDNLDEPDLIAFQGALNGEQPDLRANARLVEVGLDRSKEFVSGALVRRAEMIRIDPRGERSVATWVIDGVPVAGERLQKQDALAITQMLKLLAGMDIRDRKSSQNGGIKAEYTGKPYELRLSSVGVEGGERLTIRVNDLSVKRDNLTDLGIDDELRTKIRKIASKKGLFFVVGATGTGVTTTLYAVLRGLDPYLHQIFTLGDTGGRKLDNITPFEVKPGDTLETSIQRVLRVDGDVLLIDPINDADNAKLLTKYAENAAILTEFAARDVISGLLQFLKWIEDPQVVGETVNGLMSQKLLRLLCPKCRQAFKPNAQFLMRVGLPPTTSVLFRAPKLDEEEEPCRKCNGTGYFGRTGIYEILEMTDGLREVLKTNPEPAAIREQMKKDGGTTFQKDGLRLIAAGQTSLEELQRVFKSG
ncbi:MAG: ATPase, T2SS/T4P/T4SS family [Planctomycetales bacterium]